MSKRPVPGADAWDAWSPKQTAESLAGCGVDWAVAGGWALDLCRGAQSRPHKDIEIAVCEPALGVLRKHLGEYQFFVAEAGRLTLLANETSLGTSARQYWVLDTSVSKWRLDVMIEPGDHHTWIYRRDPRIYAPRRQVTAITPAGIPYLRPHVVLLFKAQQQRPVDERDFYGSMALLKQAERSWLRNALRVISPGHPWIDRLE